MLVIVGVQVLDYCLVLRAQQAVRSDASSAKLP